MKSSVSALQIAPRVSRRDQVLEMIAEGIVGGQWAEGDFLPGENALVQHCGASRKTVRQALQELEARKMLTVESKRGWRVRKPESGVRPARVGLVGSSAGILAGSVMRNLHQSLLSKGMGAPFIVVDLTGQSTESLKDLPDLAGLFAISGIPIGEHFLNQVRESRIPLVCVGLGKPQSYDTVDYEHRSGLEALMADLARRGFKKILFVGTGIPDASFALRRDVFQEQCRLLGLEGSLHLMKKNWFSPEEDLPAVLAAIRGGVELILAVHGKIAEQILFSLTRQGIQVPAEVSLTGIGEDPDSTVLRQFGLNSLVALRDDPRMLAEKALLALEERIAGSRFLPQSFSVPQQVVEADSIIKRGCPCKTKGKEKK